MDSFGCISIAEFNLEYNGTVDAEVPMHLDNQVTGSVKGNIFF